MHPHAGEAAGADGFRDDGHSQACLDKRESGGEFRHLLDHPEDRARLATAAANSTVADFNQALPGLAEVKDMLALALEQIEALNAANPAPAGDDDP